MPRNTHVTPEEMAEAEVTVVREQVFTLARMVVEVYESLSPEAMEEMVESVAPSDPAAIQETLRLVLAMDTAAGS